MRMFLCSLFLSIFLYLLMVHFSFVSANGVKVVDVTLLLTLLKGKNLGCFCDSSGLYFS